MQQIPVAIYFTYGNVPFRLTLSLHLTLSSPLPVSIGVHFSHELQFCKRACFQCGQVDKPEGMTFSLFNPTSGREMVGSAEIAHGSELILQPGRISASHPVSFQKCHRCADSKIQTRKNQRRWKRQVCRLHDDRRQAARWNARSMRSTFASALKLPSSYSVPGTSRSDLLMKPGRATGHR